jgi:hypothetical protein
MYTCGQSVDKILGLEFCLNFDLSELHYTQEFKLPSPTNTRWGEPTYTLVSWMQGFRHPTRNEYMGWFAQIQVAMVIISKFDFSNLTNQM